MRAAILNDFESGLAVDVMSEPHPGERDLLIRVRGSSVNGIDALAATGALKGVMEYEFPATIGTDFAGEVEAVGSSVTQHQAGDRVFGCRPGAVIHDGTWAEHVVLPEEHGFLGPIPEGVDLAQAAAAPLAAIAAIAAVSAVDPSGGDTVLIVGASGGVGSFAVQLAARRGAHVIAPGLAEDEEYLRGLGANDTIPRDGDVVGAVRERHSTGVDALVDVVSATPEDFDGFAAALRDGGRAASLLNAAGEGSGRYDVMASSHPELMKQLGEMLGAGELHVPISHTYPLAEAPAAVNDFLGSHVPGKLAIDLE